jgi:predicted RNase H-like HicB family nuclease
MGQNNDKYTYRVTWSEDDNEYTGLCAEFPSLSWLADTPEKALKDIRILVADVLLEMNKNDEQIREPIARKHFTENLCSGCRLMFIRYWQFRLLNPA